MLEDNWLLILIALFVLLVVAYVLLRPRQRVRLSDQSAPLRPHMPAPSRPAEGHGLAGEAAAATSDVTGELLNAPVHRALAGSGDKVDDLVALKGIGPKLAQTLNELKARGAAVVVVAHRVGILAAVDKILVLRDGRIEAYGARDEVMAKLSGKDAGGNVPAKKAAS